MSKLISREPVPGFLGITVCTFADSDRLKLEHNNGAYSYVTVKPHWGEEYRRDKIERAARRLQRNAGRIEG